MDRDDGASSRKERPAGTVSTLMYPCGAFRQETSGSLFRLSVMTATSCPGPRRFSRPKNKELRCYPSFSLMSPARSSACLRIAASSSPSIMTRTFGSVPE